MPPMRPPLSAPAICEWTYSDGYRGKGRVWRASDNKSDFAFLYFHGIQSHGGWYEWSGSLLASLGSPVLMPDRRGSGMNTEQRGDVSDRQRWNSDVDDLVDWMRREWRVRRLGVIGVSWGGKLAAALALRTPEIVSHVLLVTPGIYPAVDVGVGGRLSIAASLIAGGNSQHAIPLSDPNLFTDNPDAVAFIQNDEKKLTSATARFLYQSAKFDGQLRRAKANQLQCRATLVLAENDRIIRNEPTQQWAARIGGPNMNVVLMPGQSHTLEFAQDEKPFRKLLETWGMSAVSEAARAKSRAT